jgi:hypothetical protein
MVRSKNVRRRKSLAAAAALFSLALPAGQVQGEIYQSAAPDPTLPLPPVAELGTDGGAVDDDPLDPDLDLGTDPWWSDSIDSQTPLQWMHNWVGAVPLPEEDASTSGAPISGSAPSTEDVTPLGTAEFVVRRTLNHGGAPRAVPEPATGALLLLGVALAGARRRPS